MNVVHRSIFFSALERYGNLIFFIVTAAVLSRLLTPKEFGIYALINAAVGMTVALFQEFGGANYLIQKRSLSEKDIRAAFTITLCLSALTAIGVYELRGVAADFFSEDRLNIGLSVATLNIILTPFSMTISALLRRDMSFGVLARCNIAGGFVTAVTSITLAVLKFSFMAPVWGTIVGNCATLAFLIASRNDLRIFKPSFSGYGDIVAFGAYSSGTLIINIFYNMAPQFILARVLDFNAVGLYSRATSITQVFDKVVVHVFGPIILPAVSAHIRRGSDLKILYLNSIELITALQWSFLIFFALMTKPIILIWLGPTWSEIIPLIRLLCVASLSLFAASLTYPFLVATGHVRDTLTSSLISLPPSLLLLFIAAFFGIRAVAAAALLALPFQAIVALYFVSRRLAVKPSDLWRATLKSAVVAAGSVLGVLTSIIIAFGITEPLPKLILATIFAAVGWGLGLIITRHPLLEHMRLAMTGIAASVVRLRDRGKKIHIG